MDGLLLPVDCLFEAGTGEEVVDDREYGYWADG